MRRNTVGMRIHRSQHWDAAKPMVKLVQILCQPIEKSFVPELTVLRLQHPVTLVGEEQQF
jgi:hypothetical protein